MIFFLFNSSCGWSRECATHRPNEGHCFKHDTSWPTRYVLTVFEILCTLQNISCHTSTAHELCCVEEKRFCLCDPYTHCFQLMQILLLVTPGETTSNIVSEWAFEHGYVVQEVQGHMWCMSSGVIIPKRVHNTLSLWYWAFILSQHVQFIHTMVAKSSWNHCTSFSLKIS